MRAIMPATTTPRSLHAFFIFYYEDARVGEKAATAPLTLMHIPPPLYSRFTGANYAPMLSGDANEN